MNALVTALFATLLALIVSQGVLVVGFVMTLWRWRRTLVDDEAAPKAAILLALRGGDPFLQDCLDGLARQDYPHYDVFVVIDHPLDPAHEIVRDWCAAHPGNTVQIQFLVEPRSTCSLKCSSIVQLVKSLDESYAFVAQTDADTIPHPTWLRELATALTDERVGAATGNRWYMPQHPSWGAMVRYIWNAAAVVQMYWYRIPWGGTLAVKTQVFRDTDLLDRWGRAFCEDTMLFDVLKTAKLQVAFVPSLMMINREDCGLGGFYRWVRRQLLTARLYHPAWLAVVGHGVVTSIMPLVVVGLLIATAVTGDWPVFWRCALGMAIYQVAVTAMLPPMEWAVRRIATARGEPTHWLRLTTIPKYLLSIALTQAIYFVALLSACTIRSVDWRGVTYRIGGPWDIQLLQYRPFEKPAEPASDATSL